MHLRQAVALLAIVVALSLVAAPVTMSDWGEQATFSVEKVPQSTLDGETPVLEYTNLSADAQTAVRRAIESPEGHYTVYGHEDWPDQFFYSDYSAPGQGLYAIVYEGQYYRLYTYAGGGFPFVYWLYELPFISYGLFLGWVARSTYVRKTTLSEAVFITAPGVGFHLLGPEFDFPLLAPMQFIGLGVVITSVAVLGFIWVSTRRASTNGCHTE
jgi:hypothetical protein